MLAGVCGYLWCDGLDCDRCFRCAYYTEFVIVGGFVDGLFWLLFGVGVSLCRFDCYLLVVYVLFVFMLR